MSSLLPAVTTAALVSGYTSIDQKTIDLIFQLTVGAGVYETGGIPAGIVALAGSLTVTTSDFLQATIQSELPTPSSGNSYVYRYVPATDYLQIYAWSSTAGTIVELSSSAVIPAGVLTDVVTAVVKYNRLPTV